VSNDSDPVVASYSLGDFELESGAVLRDAHLTYALYGSLNEDRSNCVIIPTWFSGTHVDHEWMIGRDRPLDPTRCCVVIPDQFGSGLSTSPSNVRHTYVGPFPRVTVADNVRAQRRLLSEELRVDSVALATGVSMGAMQAYEWAAQFPHQVATLLPIAGSARTSKNTWLFVEGLKQALLSGQQLEDGWFRDHPLANLKVLALVALGSMHGPSFINRAGFNEMGYQTLDAYCRDVIAGILATSADDLLLQIDAWQAHDVAGTYGDTADALAAIRARTIVMSIAGDLYFPPGDAAQEVELLRNGELRILPGDYGHVACSGALSGPVRFVDEALKDLLTDVSLGV
jgi:homoserine O-acetyltransferase